MLLNIALIAIVCMLGYQLRKKWLEGLEQERKIHSASLPPAPVPAPPPLRRVGPLDGPSYGDVATRNLFSADRNPTPIPEPPPPPPPEPKMPPLPSAYGVMLWEGVPPTVVLGIGNSPQKGYHPGDKIGEFKVLSVSSKEVVFEWNGKEVSKRLDEIMAKNSPPPDAPKTAAPPPAQEPAANLNANVKGPGKENGGVRMCNPGDTSPPGTIVDGYQKKQNITPFNTTCYWEPVK